MGRGLLSNASRCRSGLLFSASCYLLHRFPMPQIHIAARTPETLAYEEVRAFDRPSCARGDYGESAVLPKQSSFGFWTRFQEKLVQMKVMEK
ncbi:hypothetical protein KSP40_PGU017494 [Platanthera guangdongensis]|uniref:Secreted protein n=1 Tax=Platanthera guangdongensis TaxID=2320717 RepID=A0ABR2MNU4_9ASPA